MKNLFDLSARPDVIASHLAIDAHFADVVARSPGLAHAGAFDGFELAVRAILGQRISVPRRDDARGPAGRTLRRADRDTLAGPEPPFATRPIDWLPPGYAN